MEIPMDLNIFKAYLSNFEQSAFSWTIDRSNVGGRGVFARSLIKNGSLIFHNKPLILGPRTNGDVETYCAYCYEISSSCYTCDKCLIIVCSKKCETSQKHIQECSYICNTWKLREKIDNVPKTLTKAIIYLRSILLTDKQKLILNLLQKCDIEPLTNDYDKLCNLYIIPDEQLKFMKIIYSILRANSFRINKKKHKKVPLRGLYPVSSFLNHSCLPNTRTVFHEDYAMSVYATRDIEKGEEILCCYTGLLWGTPLRRIQLFKSKNFWCRCNRCSDPSEMGTNLAALKCNNLTCDNLILPSNPLDPKSSWRCKKCNNFVTSNKINNVQSILGSLIGTLNIDELELKHNILQRLQLFVPNCNHILVELRLRKAISMGQGKTTHLSELSDSRLELKESLCRDTLRTLAALGVGDAHLRGLLMYHLHAALAERARRTPDLYEELKSEIECTIDQAHKILQDDISAPPDLELRRKYLGAGCEKPQEERFFILSEALKNSVTDIIFEPYAQSDYDKYTTTVKEVIDPWGFCVKGIHTFSDPLSAVNSAKAIFVGGGNTFRLLKELYQNNLVKKIQHRVNYENLVYIGSSAGTNVATISIHTTNDMPIVYPPTFDSIGIVPFNINPHYIEKPESVTHRGETRDQRICEYLDMPHAKTVLGLKEGCILEVKGRSLILKGVAGAVLFERGQQKRELSIGEDVSYLMKTG